ncbi:hypothetical protein Pcinc_008267 [Petrolisthes cinctipes]|uniref:Uncharacterized protein n=1 Tax=Petrolisthes cinctipes TaxID=88211 RepID=A0AAE1G933_PETCI|nr:hypothetical protein Pcinc_008267 [Petrolisthes cinctipes]
MGMKEGWSVVLEIAKNVSVCVLKCVLLVATVVILKLTRTGKVIMKTGVPRPSKESVLTHQAGAEYYVAEAVAEVSAIFSS